VTKENVKKVPHLYPEGWPVWWSPKGLKMVLAESDLRGYVAIKSTAAQLELFHAPRWGGWNVHWWILSAGNFEVTGHTFMTDGEIAGAFGFQDSISEGIEWLIERYGGDSASLTHIRYRQYLNIPRPGTAYIGDPNISIELDDRMRDAVRGLLGAQYA